jgi:RNA polymerase sigma factor (sigma-70 family)
MKPTNRRLLERLQSGETDGWSEFTKLYYPFIVGQLKRLILIQDADADDIAQNIFLVLHARIPGFRHQGIGTFRAFLKEIARRQALSWINRKRPKQLPQGFDGSQVKNNLNRWVESGSKLSLEFERHHHEHWQRLIWEEVRRRLGPNRKRRRNFEIYRQVKIEEKSVATVAEDFQVSCKTAYRAIIETQQVVVSVCKEWEYFID